MATQQDEREQRAPPFPGPNKRDRETARVLEAQKGYLVKRSGGAGKADDDPKPYNRMCRVKGCGCAMVERWHLTGASREVDTDLVCSWAGLDKNGRPVHVQPEIEE